MNEFTRFCFGGVNPYFEFLTLPPFSHPWIRLCKHGTQCIFFVYFPFLQVEMEDLWNRLFFWKMITVTRIGNKLRIWHHFFFWAKISARVSLFFWFIFKKFGVAFVLFNFKMKLIFWEHILWYFRRTPSFTLANPCRNLLLRQPSHCDVKPEITPFSCYHAGNN